MSPSWGDRDPCISHSAKPTVSQVNQPAWLPAVSLVPHPQLLDICDYLAPSCIPSAQNSAWHGRHSVNCREQMKEMTGNLAPSGIA